MLVFCHWDSMIMTQAPVVLIITEEQDVHADMVIPKLQARGVRPYRFHTADMPLLANMALTFQDNQWTGYLDGVFGRLDVNAIHSAWYRRPGDPSLPPNTMTPEARTFSTAETIAARRGLWRSINCFWVSEPGKITEASFKVEQLQSASKIGFRTPKTLITNNPDELQRFYQECNGEVIYKTLWRPSVEYGHMASTILTTPVTTEHLKNINNVRLSACLFQEYVHKQIELRICVIGQQVFAVEIHSQAVEATKYDWRNYPFEDLPHMPHRLPTDVRDFCLRLVIDHYGLAFGAIDMIVTPSGEYVFLEINPNGQWAWLELVTDLPLTDAMAHLLATGKLI